MQWPAGYPPQDGHGSDQGAGPGTWKELLEEVPARLEGCRQRLAAADRAVSKAYELGICSGQQQTAGADAEMSLLQSQLDQVIKDSQDRGDPGRALDAATTSTTEADLISVDKEKEAKLKAESTELNAQISSIHGQLGDIDKRWQSAEEDRLEGNRTRSVLEEKLKTAEVARNSLEAKLNQLQKANESGEATIRELESTLAELQVDHQKVRADFGVSEKSAQELKSRVADLQDRETELKKKEAALTTRVTAAENDLKEASDKHETTKTELGSASQKLQELESALAEEKLARAAAEERASSLQQEIDLIQPKLQASESQVQHLQNDIGALNSRLQGHTAAAEASAGLSRPFTAPAEMTDPRHKGSMIPHCGSDEDLQRGDANAATLPPLQHETNLDDTNAGKYAPKADLLLRAEGISSEAAPRPAQCQVDAAIREMRLLSLGPIGEPQTIPFADIVDVVKAHDASANEVSIRWVPNRSTVPEIPKPETRTLKLWPSCEETANALVAALTVHVRAAPGDVMQAPPTRSSSNSSFHPDSGL